MDPNTVLLIAAAGVAFLLVMIIRLRVEPFVALLLTSFAVAVAGGIPLGETAGLITSGIGSVLGSVAVVIALGAMLGQIVDTSGGARAVAHHFGGMFGERRTPAMLAAVGFVLGIPVFFDVGFIILAPILVGFARVASRPVRFIGLSAAIAMLTVHVALPPHPGPVAAANILGADVGLLTLVGFALSIPVAIAGHLTAMWVNRRLRLASDTAQGGEEDASAGAGTASEPAPNPYLVCALIVLPIAVILLGTLGTILVPETSGASGAFRFLTSPVVALLIALGFASWLLGRRRGWSRSRLEEVMGSALPSVASVILITGAGGAFGRVLTETGAGAALSGALSSLGLPLLLAAFLIALALRVSQGSATVAILTTAGLLAEPVAQLPEMQRILVTLAVCFGAVGLSHVNDSGFWIVTRYLRLSVSEGLRSWTVVTTVASLTGLAVTSLAWLVA